MDKEPLNNYDILITDDVHPILLSELEGMGARVNYIPDVSLKAVHDMIYDYQGIVVNSKIKCDRPLLQKASQLKFIARLGSGLDIIDLSAAEELGIQVINSPEGNRNAVAEHAMAMLLALSNNILSGHQEILKAPWDREKHRGFEWKGKTIGVYGYGHTGEAFAQKWAGFEVNVLAYDKYKEHYIHDSRFIRESSKEDLLEFADVISFHLPLMDETRYLINRSFLDACKKGVVIVNTSRGKILRIEDLITALDQGIVGGACLDVFDNEKSETWTEVERAKYLKLTGHEYVICSPHVAGWTEESKKRIALVLVDKIITIGQSQD